MKDNRLKAHALTNSLANSVATPFVAFNVTETGGNNLLVGYVQAISTLASGVSQLVGGRIVDRLGKRLTIATLFSAVVGLLWLVTAVLPGTTSLAISYTAITLALGSYAAGWSSFLGEASEGNGRGAFLASFARLAALGSLVALLMTTAITAVNPSYSTLYLIAGAVFVLSSVVLRGQKEEKVERTGITTVGTAILRRYYFVSGFYGLFWGFAWPLFTITTVKVVNMSLVEYSLSQVLAVASTIAFQPLVGRFVDRNRKRGVFWGRMGLVVYPVAYAFFTAPWEIYAINVFSGFTNALLNIVFSAYLYDLSPTGHRGRHIAEFNLVTGVTTMAGSLVAAFALNVITPLYGLWLSLAYLYAVATVGRAAAAFLHLRLPY